MVSFSRPWSGPSAGSDGAGSKAGSSGLRWTWAGGAAAVALAPFAIIAASAALQALQISYRAYWKLRHIPGPPPNLLLGNLPDLIRMGGSHKAVYQWRKDYGPTFKFFILWKPFVVFTDADVCRQVAFRYLNHAFFVNENIKVMNGRNMILDDMGLAQAKDGFWRMLRNAWTPAFAPGTLARYYAIMDATAVELVQHLDALAPWGQAGATNGSATTSTTATNGSKAAVPGDWTQVGSRLSLDALNDAAVLKAAAEAAQQGSAEEGYLDIHDLLNKMTLEVVGKSAYGVKFHALDPPSSLPADAPGPALSRACKDMFATSTMQSGSKWGLAMAMLPLFGWALLPLALAFPDKPLIRSRESRALILKTSAELISDMRAKHPTLEQQEQAARDARLQAADADGVVSVVKTTRGDMADDDEPPTGRLSGIEPGSFLALMLDAQQRTTAPRPAATSAPNSTPSNSFNHALPPSPNTLGPLLAGSATSASSPRPPSFSRGLSTGPAAGGAPAAQQMVMTDLAVVAQANTFILAGTETTANTLTFCIFYIAQHPDVEARLVKEVLAHGPVGASISGDDKFPYADAIINETMRVMPAAHATSREMERPGGQEVGGYYLPERTSVLVPIFMLHNHPDYYPRHDEWLPERWLPENEAELGVRNPNAFMPFGAGSRQCPGYKFAQQEARIALVSLFKSFTFQLHPDMVGKPLPVQAGITLSPRFGLRCRVLPRKA